MARGPLNRLGRWLRGSRLGRASAIRLGAGYIRLCWITTRWKVEGEASARALLDGGAPIVAPLWHGRLFFAVCCAPPGRRIVGVISNNRDGDLIAGILGRFGVDAVRGSSADPRKREKDKGGGRAFAGGLAALRDGAILVLTPDGPRGPRMRAQPGVAALALAAGATVAPIAISTRNGKFARSWDRFLIPRPFDRGAVLYGAPIPPPTGSDAESLDAHRLRIETALNDLTRRADEMVGRAPIEPEPA